MTNEQKIRFVIVDDEQSIRRLCMTVGQGLGFECAEAETAEAALESLEAVLPDIIVTDLKLPNPPASARNKPASGRNRPAPWRNSD